ncbi:MAG: transposase [Chloroflexota bacterium]
MESVWKEIPLHYSLVNNEVFMVMPNHIHGIIVIQTTERAGSKPAPTKHYPLSEIVRAFKTYSSRRINKLRNTQGMAVWQRNYYEHVIRGERDYQQIGEYILHNPAKWGDDSENPNTKL